MKSYNYTKPDGSRWLFYYDTNIQYWTVLNVDSEGNQISGEAEYYRKREAMVLAHAFNFKNFT